MRLHIRRAANDDHESKIHDIIATKEKQAAPKETFVFPVALTSKRPMKSDKRAQGDILSP